MQLLRRLEELDAACQGGACITIGVFDAIHRGHQMLIKRARDQARMRALQSLVFTFERHPLSLIAPAYCPPVLTQPEDKARLIGELEVDNCLMLPFTPDFARVEAEDFIRAVLVGRCRARYLTCGWNFSFGAGGRGDVDLLRRAGRTSGFDVEICDPLSHGASPISSTRIRQYLLDGRVVDAAHLLGRCYAFPASVIAGDRRGREIGFPTANLNPPKDQLIPADGVYAVSVTIGEKSYAGMLNIGNRPTFEGAGRSIEAHLFEFDGDVLGQTVHLDFIERVREEKKFDGVEQLIAQLERDKTTCIEICRRARG